VMAAKAAIQQADELSLTAGLEFERRTFHMLFATEDQKEGMRAFIEKRAPEWHGK
jgi:enoyl-CoA hydratase